MISQTAEYALRAIFFMAEHSEKSHVTQQIADGTRVPVGYLAKVLQGLHKAGLVNAQRGLGGGFTLARPSTSISVYDVVQAVDPIQRIHTCPLKLTSHGTNLCPLHRHLDDVMAKIEEEFKKHSVAQLLAQPSTSRPLCPFPFPVPNRPSKP